MVPSRKAHLPDPCRAWAELASKLHPTITAAESGAEVSNQEWTPAHSLSCQTADLTVLDGDKDDQGLADGLIGLKTHLKTSAEISASDERHGR